MKSNGKHKTRHLVKDGPTPAEKKWARIIDRWKASELTGRQFCQKRQIDESSFRHWVKEIARSERLRHGAGGICDDNALQATSTLVRRY